MNRVGTRGRRIGLACLLTFLFLLGATAVAAAAPAEFTAQTPAPDSSVQSLRPTISVKIYDEGRPRLDSALWVKVDGKTNLRVTKTYDRLPGGGYDYTRVTVTAVPRADLARGLHTVEVSELNWAGARYSTSWSFRIGEPPTLDSPSPTPGSTATTDGPTITARVVTGAFQVAPAVLVDGAEVAATFDYGTSLVTAPILTPLANDTSHDVTVTVVNGDGLSASLAWSFSVLTQPRMPDTTGGTCQQCHTTYPAEHPMDDCDACHGYNGPIGGFYGPPDFHPEGEAAQLLGDCSFCHAAAFPAVPRHSQPVEVYHSAGLGADPCKPCHVSDLLAEHYYRTLTNDCMLCHASSDPNVTATIASGGTACLGCHPTYASGHGGSHESEIANQSLSGSYPSGAYGPFACNACHAVNLTSEHLKASSSSAAAGCGNCHPAPRNTLTPSWAKGCVQNGCHPDGSASMQHGLMSVAHMPLPENAPCIGCHTDGDLGELHVNASDGTNTSCFVCHTDTGPPSAKNCISCHPERVDPHGYDAPTHESNVGANTISGSFPSGGTYGPIRCDECHLTGLGPEHERTTASSAAAGCANCHPAPRDTLTPWAKGCAQAGCHPAGSESDQHAQMSAAHAQPPQNAACTASGCHDDGDLSAVHEDAPEECLVCHSTVTVPAIGVCTECHGTPHGDLNAAHTADEPGGMFWANTGAFAPCTQCHRLDIRAEHAKASSGSLDCPACHVAGGPVSSLPGGVWNKHCTACHSTIHPEYDAEHVAYGQDCNGCHGDPEDARDFHPSCGVSPSDGNTPNSEALPCHIGPDYVPYPQLGPPWTNGFWCRTCHPEE